MNEVSKQKPDNYLVWAILVTVMCCVPLGIVSIVKSTQVDSYWAAGNYEEAIKASEDAQKWAIYGVVGFAVVMLLYVIVFVIIGITA